MADKFHRRCCYNCRHHLDYQNSGRYAETVIDRDVDAEARRLNEEREAEDRQRKADLKEYRKQHPKPYYLNR